MDSLNHDNQADVIEAFNSTFRYLDDLLYGVPFCYLFPIYGYPKFIRGRNHYLKEIFLKLKYGYP